MPLRYLSKQLQSSYVPYVRFKCLMKMNSDELPLSEFLSENRKASKELGIPDLHSAFLHRIQSIFGALLIETAEFHFNDHTLSTTIDARCLYQLYMKVL